MNMWKNDWKSTYKRDPLQFAYDHYYIKFREYPEKKEFEYMRILGKDVKHFPCLYIFLVISFS